MKLSYVHLRPDEAPPSVMTRPYRAVMIAELAPSHSWRNDIASWIVQSGCLYFIAWGIEREVWNDIIDWTVLEGYDFGDIPDEKFVMTTWHDKEPLAEALWFAGHSGSHPDIDLPETVIVHVLQKEQCAATLRRFNGSQALADEG